MSMGEKKNNPKSVQLQLYSRIRVRAWAGIAINCKQIISRNTLLATKYVDGFENLF